MIKVLNTAVAKIVGTTAAVVFQHINYWMKTQGVDVVYRSNRELAEDLEGVYSESQIQRAKKKLIDAGLILISFNKKQYWNRTSHYSLTKKGQGMVVDINLSKKVPVEKPKQDGKPYSLNKKTPVIQEPVGHAAAESPEMKSSFDEQGKNRDGVTKIPESLLAMMKGKLKRSSDESAPLAKESHQAQDSNLNGSGVSDTNIPSKSKHTFSAPKQRLGDRQESGMLTSSSDQCDNTHVVNNFNIGDLFKRTTPSPNYM